METVTLIEKAVTYHFHVSANTHWRMISTHINWRMIDKTAVIKLSDLTIQSISFYTKWWMPTKWTHCFTSVLELVVRLEYFGWWANWILEDVEIRMDTGDFSSTSRIYAYILRCALRFPRKTIASTLHVSQADDMYCDITVYSCYTARGILRGCIVDQLINVNLSN